MFHATVLAFTTDLANLFEPRGAGPVTEGDDLAPARLAEFNAVLATAAPGSGALAAEEIAIAARSVLAQARDGSHPFVRERMAMVPQVLSMMADEDWCLGDLQRRRARALVDYVRAANDLIPDQTPVIGLLDDAILVDRCLVALQDELADWRDFHAFRAELAALRGVALADCHPSRQQWLAERTRAFARARRLRETRRGGYARASQPVAFRVGG
jgi:uncharacterized membrane protein YkvA (DUF1232 family)